MTESPRRGRFVVLEGVEGSGKSTQLQRLARRLDAEGVPCTVAREPGGTPVGEAIRRVVLSRDELDMPPESELLLFLAARAAFVRDVVRPALERGELLLADRHAFSTFAYQGYGRGLELDTVRALNAFATGGLVPDLYVVLDLPVEEGLARQRREGKEEDRIERDGAVFLERVRRGYRALAEGVPGAVVVDADGTPDAVHERIWSAVTGALPETFRNRPG